MTGRHLHGARWRVDDRGTASFAVLAVLLLVLFAWSAAFMLPGPGGLAEERPSLASAEEELTAFLARALDDALVEALPLAASGRSTTLGEALDAALARRVRATAPSVAGGWCVGGVQVSGDYLGSGPADPGTGAAAAPPGSPTASMEVELTGGQRASVPPVRLAVRVEGRPVATAPWVGALSGGEGAVAHTAEGLLEALVQTRAVSSQYRADRLLTVEDVKVALDASVAAMTSPGPSPGPGVSVDLSGLVAQSVEGLVQRNLGWLCDYMPWTGAVAYLDDGLMEKLSDLLARVVLEVLDASLGGLPVVEGEDLAAVVTQGLAALERAGAELDEGALVAAVARSLEGAVPGLPGELAGPVASAMGQAAALVASGGLSLAEGSLVAMGRTGRQAVTPPVIWEGGTSVRFRDVSISTSWTGMKTTDPPDLLSPDRSAVDWGTLPYLSTCRLSVSGKALVEVRTVGAAGRPLRAAWTAPVDLGLELSVVTGGPLEGVEYEPTATLAGDAAAVAAALWGRATSSLGWLTARFRDAAGAVCSWAEDLLSDMRESLMTESAYTLSQALWKVGRSLGDRKVDAAINGTWDLLMDLFGDDLREALTWKVSLMGWDLVVSLDPERQQLDLEASWRGVAMDLAVRRLCDPHPPFRARPIEGYHWGVFGEARVATEGGEATLHLDPLTLERASVLTLEVTWGGGGGGGDGDVDGGVLVLEAMEARELSSDWKVSLSQLLGEGWALSLAGGAMADAGVALHGSLMRNGSARKVLEGALKEAWLATMRGWKVGDLLGETGRGPDADAFLQTLMRELEGALTEGACQLVSELEVFLEVRFPGPEWPDLRLSLVVSEPLRALLPLAAWAKRWLEPLVGRALSGGLDGPAMAMEEWLAERVSVRAELAWAVEVPPWLASRSSAAMPDRLGLVLRLEANLASLLALAGRSRGRWEVSVDVGLRGVPGALLAVVPGMGSPGWEWAEVTLVRGTLRELSRARLLLSQVLYDAQGRDADLEYVEVLNAGRRMLDLEGYRLEDDSGGFSFQGHLPLLPGDRFLVARNSSAVLDRWGVLPDLGGMGLRLANDGDQVSLLDGDGSTLDALAWEGHLEGWETLEAGEGMALCRTEGDLRSCQRDAWSVGPPSPSGSGW